MKSKYKNIKSIVNYINSNIIFSFGTIIITLLFLWIFIHHEIKSNYLIQSKQEVRSASRLFESFISRRVKLVASSSNFYRYLESGEKSRKSLKIDFLRSASKLQYNEVSGMFISDKNGKEIFSQGNKSEIFITVELCYLNNEINSEYGNCDYTWTFFFDKKEIINEILNLNPNLISCNSRECFPADIFNKSSFGDLKVLSSHSINAKFLVKKSKDYVSLIFIFIILIVISFGVWIFTRVFSIIKNNYSNPLSETINSLKSGSLPDDRNYIEELQFLKKEISNFYDSKEKAKIGEMASEVVHDLKSYLFCLYELMDEIKNHEKKKQIEKIFFDINLMLSNVLDKYKFNITNPKNTKLTSIMPFSVYDLISDFTDFAKIMCTTRNVTFTQHISFDCNFAFIKVDPNLFNRMLLNFVTNALDAGSTIITVSIKLFDQSIKIKISDNGSGIPNDVLEKIGKERFSYKKNEGHGIGIISSISSINSWGGNFSIKSNEVSGTDIFISLPNIEKPNYFITSIFIKSYKLIVIVDDEEYIHHLWSKLLKNINIPIASFYSPKDFTASLSSINRINTLFLIDNQYKHHKEIRGLDLIEKYNLQDSAILVTGGSKDPNVISKCVENNIRILPKNNIEIIKLD